MWQRRRWINSRTWWNQSDSIKISEYKPHGVSCEFKLRHVPMEQKFYAYYIPATYSEFADHEVDLSIVDIDELNQHFLLRYGGSRRRNEGNR